MARMSRRTGAYLALAAALPAALALTAAAGGASTTKPAPAYCSIPTVQNPPWGFRAGEQITTPTGSYAHGHGNIDLAKQTVNGIICQVDRVRDQPDRQIILSVDRHLVYATHTASMWGSVGNEMKIDVRVKSSTDPKCKVGTAGKLTLFASYSGSRQDSVQFSFPAACKRHRHLYRGSDVVVFVPVT
jgi:hypothetical protein